MVLMRKSYMRKKVLLWYVFCIYFYRYVCKYVYSIPLVHKLYVIRSSVFLRTWQMLYSVIYCDLHLAVRVQYL